MLAGIVVGLLYEIFSLFRFFVKNKAAQTVADILFFILAGGVFVGAAVLFRLPDMRIYMLAAALAGLWLYTKTLHRTVAFFAGKLYNKCRSVCKDLAMRAAAYHERRKIQKNRSRSHGSGRHSARHTSRLHDLPVDCHFRPGEAHRRTGRAVCLLGAVCKRK